MGNIFNEFTVLHINNQWIHWQLGQSIFGTIKRQTYIFWKLYAPKIWQKLHVCASTSHCYKLMMSWLTAGSHFMSSTLPDNCQMFSTWMDKGNMIENQFNSYDLHYIFRPTVLENRKYIFSSWKPQDKLVHVH